VKKTFGRSARLCRSEEFQSIFKQGHTFRESYCKVYLHPNARPCSRLGVIIAKKTVPLSTARHQFKRIVRESFRLSSERLSGYDMIVMLKQPPQNKTELWGVLDLIWQKISHFRLRYK